MPAVRRLLLVLSAAAAVVLTGCGVTGPVGTAPPSTPPAESAEVIATVSVTGPALRGTGPSPDAPGLDLRVPEGTRSVTVDLTCEGGGPFHVELGDSMMLGQALLRGTCDGTTTLAWPFTAETAQTLSVWVLDGVDWEAVPHYSTAEFESDPALTSECAAFAAVYSDLSNAELGYTEYRAFGADEWTARVDAAAADLDALVARSETTLGPALTEVLSVARSAGRAPGSILAAAVIDPIGAACDTNHSPLILTAEFGG